MKIWFLLCTLPLAGCFFSSNQTAAPLEYSGSAFGSYYKVKYISGPTTPGPDALKAESEKILNDYNNEFSAWKDDSFLSRFNKSQEDKVWMVSQTAMEMMAVASEVWLATGGAFDPTVGPLVQLWGFGPKKAPRVPSDKEIHEVMRDVGLDKLAIDPMKVTWHKIRPKLTVDVNAIAPGQAADLLGRQLNARGVEHYLIDVGGELLARGERSSGQPWMVGIERPSQTHGEAIVATVPLSAGAIATSGNYRNYLDTKSGRISHTIDPRTGKQPAHKTVSATVIADSAMSADAWATALMVLGPSSLTEGEVAKQIQRRGLKVFLLEELADGTFREHINPAMAELLKSR